MGYNCHEINEIVKLICIFDNLLGVSCYSIHYTVTHVEAMMID